MRGRDFLQYMEKASWSLLQVHGEGVQEPNSILGRIGVSRVLNTKLPPSLEYSDEDCEILRDQELAKDTQDPLVDA